jgi:hypothetical protein
VWNDSPDRESVLSSRSTPDAVCGVENDPFDCSAAISALTAESRPPMLA